MARGLARRSGSRPSSCTRLITRLVVPLASLVFAHPASAQTHPKFPVTDGRVAALAVSGNTVYAGGEFTNVGGQPRARVAAIDALTGAALPLDIGTDGTVRALALAQGRLCLGGDFMNVDGQIRHHLAAVDCATGQVAAWNPD